MNPFDGPELVVEEGAVSQRARLIRVPEFVADVWDAQSPGACIGVLQPNGTLRLSKAQGAIVTKLSGQLERLSDEVVVGCASQQPLDELPRDARLLGVLESSTTFLPNLMDPAYREFVAAQRAAQEAQTSAAAEPQVLSLEASITLEQARTRGGADDGMFKYYREGGMPMAKGAGGVSDSQMEAASATLFHLFETAEGGTLSHRDIQQNIHLPPHYLRRLLDQLTEPQTERLGRKSVFRLKPQFRKGG